MKKSKIIVPAVALLALGMAASVTGTVAWFTVTRTATLGTLESSTIQAPDSNFLVISPLALTDGTSSPYAISEGSSITWSDTHTLTDVSSANGYSFFKWVGGETNPAASGGDAITEAATGYNALSGNPAFNGEAVGAGGAATHTASYAYVGAKPGTIAYLRFGFYVRNVSDSALSVTVGAGSMTDATNGARVAVYKKGLTATKTDAEGTWAYSNVSLTDAMTALPAEAASGSTVYAESAETKPAAAAFAATNAYAMANSNVLQPGQGYQYIVTIWLEGQDADVKSDNFSAGAIAMPQVTFTGVINH